MKICTAEINGITPLSLSRQHFTPKKEKESHSEYEARTWREKAHYDASGVAHVKGISFKMALDSAAKFLSLQIPGKGKATYSKHFLSGVLCPEDLPLGVTRETIQGIELSMNADGKRGSGTRVLRFFPSIPKWGGKLTFYVLDDTIPKDVFQRVLVESGKFIGVGQYRPQQGGTCGRFEVKSVTWTEE